MHEPPLCTYHELKSVYTLDDFYDLLEYADAQTVLREEALKEAEKKAAQERERQKNNR